MNNKGFSLVELLAVVAILGIMSGMALTAYGQYLESSKRKAYKILADSAVTAMEEYAMDHPGDTSATLEDLVEGDYLSNIDDPSGSSTKCRGKVYAHLSNSAGSDESTDKIGADDYRASICCNGFSYTYNDKTSKLRKDRYCKIDPYNPDYIEKINVLAVHPVYNKCHLCNWMNETDPTSHEKIGKDKINITPVWMGDFNADPKKYLNNIDVVVFGFNDCFQGSDKNGNTVAFDLSDVAKKELEGGLNNDYNPLTIILGHDTLMIAADNPNCGVHTNFNDLAKNYANIDVELDVSQMPNAGGRYTTARIVRDGFLTKEPWNIGKVGGADLTVASSHVAAQVAHGDVWMVFPGASEPYTVYLSSYENVAYTQIGHVPDSTTLIEKKILANMIFSMFVQTDEFIEE